MPGAASDTIVNALTSPSVGTSTGLNSVPKHDAHALRRSKNFAPHDVHSLGDEVRMVAEHQVIDEGNLS